MGGERGGPKGCESNSAVARLLREAGAVAEGTGRDSQTCVAGELTRVQSNDGERPADIAGQEGYMDVPAQGP